jgi:hypothetical protein
MARVPAATRASVPHHQQRAFVEVVQSRGGVLPTLARALS